MGKDNTWYDSTYVDLHVHGQDLFDSDDRPERLIKRYQEIRAKGFALTQHGVLSGIEYYKEAAEKAGLSFIPGIETYYTDDPEGKNRQHLILLAENYQGYMAISMAVSESQNTSGQSVMTDKVLRDHFGQGSSGYGHVIATTACIQGPLGVLVRSNRIADREIEKLNRKAAAAGYEPAKAQKAEVAVCEAEKELNGLTAQLTDLKKTASAKVGQRQKQVEKLKEKQDPSYEAEAEQLEKDKKTAKKAAEDILPLQEQIRKVRQILAAARRELTAVRTKEGRVKVYLDKVKELTDGKMPDDDIRKAVLDKARQLNDLFGQGNFFIEVQNHGIDDEKLVYPYLAKAAHELHIPLVATNDVHMVTGSQEDMTQRRILRSLRFGQWEPVQEGDSELYVKTGSQVAEWLRKILPEEDVEEAVGNTEVIFKRCHVEYPEEKHYPKFPVPAGMTAEKLLSREIQKGAKWRFPNGMDKEHKERANREFRIIKQMGYADYFLIVKDFLEYGRALSYVPDDQIDEAPMSTREVLELARENGWHAGFTIGPGRGSAVGSLVCYLLGITNLDPLRYDLLFERFLNPERVSMPDIDSDIANRIRPKVIEYVRHLYGEGAVCGIMTVNAQAPKGAIRIAAKYYGLSVGKEGAFLPLADKMAKDVPADPGISFSSDAGGQTVMESLREKYVGDKDADTILSWALLVEGCFTAYGAHAAGVVISDNADVEQYVPLRWNQTLSEMTTQVDMTHVEAKGLIKMDFLGLRTLDVITDCIRLIGERTGKWLDPLNDIPMDDRDVYTEVFQKAQTNSVFQFESSGMKNMLKQFKPDTFEDLVILVSMFRPGPKHVWAFSVNPMTQGCAA